RPSGCARSRVCVGGARGKSRNGGAHLHVHTVCHADRSSVLVSCRCVARPCCQPRASRHMTPWLLASGDFVPLGGMDTANHALASYLARRSNGPVHLVAHRVSPDLTRLPQI